MSNPYQLYLVTDENQSVETLVNVVKAAVAGGVTMVQVREKHGDIRSFIDRAAAVKKALKGTSVPLIINDRVDVALAVDADGVHLGQSDMPVITARELLGRDKLLGLSIENEQQLEQAESLPIDYIGLSAIFATPTKTDTVRHWGLNGLAWALQRSSYPVVAIGGINQSNITGVSRTGVHGIALVSAICHADDPEQAARQIKNQLVS
ncbi:thiamine phosphate synthase [Vibrio sonorensis]|uniref:thiamine phosphate synthase n=1 Tax=Vibrio sonorensis TaxID=1004316 RepID=UPI0008D931D3|nr:thiamine phosphate synthase [Vibrio sonorensis]